MLLSLMEIDGPSWNERRGAWKDFANVSSSIGTKEEDILSGPFSCLLAENENVWTSLP